MDERTLVRRRTSRTTNIIRITTGVRAEVAREASITDTATVTPMKGKKAVLYYNLTSIITEYFFPSTTPTTEVVEEDV